MTATPGKHLQAAARRQLGDAPTAKDLRRTAEAIEDRARATINAIEDMNDTLRLLDSLSESCRERATVLDGKSHSTSSSKTEPKEKDFTI